MTKSIRKSLASKWLVIAKEYDLVKQNKSMNFTHVRQISNAYNVTRRDIRKYHGRWKESGQNWESLLPRKRGPKPGTLKILSKQEERAIMGIRRRLNANEFEIYHLVKGHFKIDPSVSTIYRTFKRYPLNKKRIALIKRYEKAYPGEMIHCDTYVLDKMLFSDRKRRCLFGAIDDCTRLCYIEPIESLQALNTTRALFRAYKWFGSHGIRVREAMTDNGSEFTCYTGHNRSKETHNFEVMLKALEINHRYTRPYRPQTNGKIERFWRTLNGECLRLQDQASAPNELFTEIEGYLYRYNYRRRHSGLKHQTPLDKLKRVTEIVK